MKDLLTSKRTNVVRFKFYWIYTVDSFFILLYEISQNVCKTDCVFNIHKKSFLSKYYLNYWPFGHEWHFASQTYEYMVRLNAIHEFWKALKMLI